MIRKEAKYPKALWLELQQKANEEGFENMNAFLRHIARIYLKGDIGIRTLDLETEQLLAQQEKLRQEEYEFVNRLNTLLKTAKNEPKPEDYDQKVERVLACVQSQKLKFEDIAKITLISKEDLIVIIGNLVDSGQLGFDDTWKYYQT